jgi:hypothetical protein
MAPLLTAHQSEQLYGRGSPRSLGKHPPIRRGERLVTVRYRGSRRVEVLVQPLPDSAVQEDRS